MENRRKFIGQMATAGVFGFFPGFLSAEMKPEKPVRLLVRADDMGITWDKTLAIIKAHQEGIVMSASLMVASPFFEEAAAFCRENPALAVGVHITIVGSTWTRPVSSPGKVSSILTPAGFFYKDVAELSLANPVYEEMEREIRAQVQKARESGLKFVYLDWHKTGAPELKASAMRKEIIVRICREQQLVFGSDWEGTLHGYKRIPFVPEHFPLHKLPDGESILYPAPPLSEDDKQVFYKRLENLEAGRWVAPVHPGLAEPERKDVTELMCSRETWNIINRKKIQLVSYYDLWNDIYGKK